MQRGGIELPRNLIRLLKKNPSSETLVFVTAGLIVELKEIEKILDILVREGKVKVSETVNLRQAIDEFVEDITEVNDRK